MADIVIDRSDAQIKAGIEKASDLQSSASEIDASTQINDFILISKNLFTRANTEVGFLSQDGGIAYHAIARHTDYISLNENTEYVYQEGYGGTTRYVMYDVNKNVISVLPSNDTSTTALVNDAFITPSGTAFGRFSYRDENTFMLEKGGSFSSYEAYSPPALLTNNPSIKGSNEIDIRINGNNARVTTSAGYGETKDTLMILCHGNGGDYTYKPSQNMIDFCSANKISYACITAQDDSSFPFSADAAVGWGSSSHIARIVSLYDYMMENFNFHSSVILVGASMGGLAMGNLAYTRPFPIKFCIGIGPVPSLKYIFEHGEGVREPPIRHAYGMAEDGSDDANIETFTLGYDWHKLGVSSDGTNEYKTSFPRMYLYLGVGDNTGAVQFGGDLKFLETKIAIENAGGLCEYTNVGAGYAHAADGIYDIVLTDGVIQKELEI